LRTHVVIEWLRCWHRSRLSRSLKAETLLANIYVRYESVPHTIESGMMIFEVFATTNSELSEDNPAAAISRALCPTDSHRPSILKLCKNFSGPMKNIFSSRARRGHKSRHLQRCDASDRQI
jgi:hypothetical protein